MKILFVDPHESSLFSFRKELVDALIDSGHKVVLCTQATDKVTSYFSSKVNKIIDVDVDLKSKGILSNLKIIKRYKTIIKQEKPDLIISYKIKPNIYCGFFAKKIP
ncbi:MAG: glycosyltransferase, partial [Candidatus Enteromonas sp.]|nr:glycosyltransferase [Candidatus Enteromonas sp.]